MRDITWRSGDGTIETGRVVSEGVVTTDDASEFGCCAPIFLGRDLIKVELEGGARRFIQRFQEIDA